MIIIKNTTKATPAMNFRSGCRLVNGSFSRVRKSKKKTAKSMNGIRNCKPFPKNRKNTIRLTSKP
ncbi:MAG: hypothetical protein IJO68_08075 [Clostridia bacterium]|nr:hypothetical protein [Clostridia bacterium]